MVSLINTMVLGTPWKRISGHICSRSSLLSELRWEEPLYLWATPFHGLGWETGKGGGKLSTSFQPLPHMPTVDPMPPVNSSSTSTSLPGRRWIPGSANRRNLLSFSFSSLVFSHGNEANGQSQVAGSIRIIRTDSPVLKILCLGLSTFLIKNSNRRFLSCLLLSEKCS